MRAADEREVELTVRSWPSLVSCCVELKTTPPLRRVPVTVLETLGLPMLLPDIAAWMRPLAA